MKKLWQTAEILDHGVEAYTVGEDPKLDERLLPYEVYGSLAHAAGLKKIRILTEKEVRRIKIVLGRLLAARKIRISGAQEDIHTAIEHKLTLASKNLGEKIHTGRSRNDQVQTDLRLYLKDALLELCARTCAAARAWEEFGKPVTNALMPGYTHLQRAMPATLGHWAASHAEGLLENLPSLKSAFEAADSCPLGSAAGFGVPLPLDRVYVARLLGFSRVQRNTLRVQTSRPRIEAAAVSAAAFLARDLGALAWDLSLFTTREFGFLRLKSSFTTGSSLMPQKRNPDVIELTRARAALFPGWTAQLLGLGLLPSGYHRDYQLTKGVLFRALDAALEMTAMAARLPGALEIDAARCRAAVTPEMFATQQALALVARGIHFRSAYRRVASKSRAGASGSEGGAPLLPDYPGAPGRPDWRALEAERSGWERWTLGTRDRLHRAWGRLLKP